jgi:nucleotide-binding universal stress UspA family protein
VKTILVDLDTGIREDGRLDCAADLARAFGSHVIGLQVTPLSDLVGFDVFGGVFTLSAVLDAVAQNEKEIREAFEGKTANEGLNWEFRHSEGPPAAVIGQQSRLADLVLVAKPGDGDHKRLAHVGELALSSSAPLLAIPPGARGFDPFGKAIIAWNGSPEASAAVRAALPMLKLASEVTVVTAEEPDAKWDIPPTGLAEYLSRHDIHASAQRVSSTTADVPQTMLREVTDRQPAYLVMGAYGRSRASEWVLGGFTRRMLLDLPVPVLLSH